MFHFYFCRPPAECLIFISAVRPRKVKFHFCRPPAQSFIFISAVRPRKVLFYFCRLRNVTNNYVSQSFIYLDPRHKFYPGQRLSLYLGQHRSLYLGHRVNYSLSPFRLRAIIHYFFLLGLATFTFSSRPCAIDLLSGCMPAAPLNSFFRVPRHSFGPRANDVSVSSTFTSNVQHLHRL